MKGNGIIGLFNILTIIGALGEILGLYLLGKKNKLGFISFMICGISWFISAFLSNPINIGLLIVIPITFTLNIVGLIKWGKDKDN